MQYVDDDMDELFRKAAKDYPLNTGSADWEKVSKALEEPPAGEQAPGSKDNRRHLLWLLLLLPLPWICTRYLGEDKVAPGEPVTNNEQGGLPTERYMKGQTGGETTQGAPETSSEATIGPNKALSPSGTIQYRSVAPEAGRRANNGLTRTPLPTEILTSKEHTLSDVVNKEQERIPGALTPPTALTETKTDIQAAVKDSAQRDTTALTEPSAQKPPQKAKAKGFYSGVMGGLDMTSVEMQKVKKVGYDLGVVLGYAINENWSVETGLISAEKAYYSTGEHLYKAYQVPGAQLREAQGDCRMWEVPLVVQYHFTPGRKGGWFASAGSSSYFMQKETYDYTYLYTATGQEVKHHRTYDSNSRHLFAAAQLSGGYIKPLGKSLDLRIEPYVKLPLGKVGYYELPLTSFGIHAGITKKL